MESLLKKLSFIACILGFSSVYSQYTEVINSNRPGFSESPYSVGSGVYQLETSIFTKKISTTPIFSNPEATGVNFLFRTSFLSEKLEFNANVSWQKDKIAFKNIFESSYNVNGFSQITIGAKYLVYQPTYDDKTKEIRSWKKRHAFDYKRFIPSVGVYVGTNINNFVTDFYKREIISPKVGILLQNEFSNKFNIITNIFYNYIKTELPEYSYIISATYNFNDYWSGFIENQAAFNKHENYSNLGIGIAYLYSKDLQFNIATRANFRKNVIGNNTSLGISFRIDKHRDPFKEVDELGNVVERGEIQKHGQKSFAKRLLSGFGIFSKKNKAKTNDDESDDIDTPREKPTRVRKKAVTKEKKKGGLTFWQKR